MAGLDLPFVIAGLDRTTLFRHRPGIPSFVMAGLDLPFVIAGLVPAISIHQTLCMREYYLYILASRPGGAIYVGVTNNLPRRLHEHRRGVADSFTKRYGIHRLVHFEAYSTAYAAIQREKNIKHWPRSWKANLIKSTNPTWNDLSKDMF